MHVYEWTSNAPHETITFAERLATLLHENDLILLEGDLGAGKTTFTKGIAAGLGIRRTVSSPTFTIIKEYHGRLPLYHMDVYRIQDSYEDLGFDEYFEGGGVTIVEWSKLIQEQLPPEYLEITIRHQGDQQRKFEFRPKGYRYESLCKELFE
ncbi:tRNA (adenosine(37)-N6)-threonylcarbamoyltransferase complex ATPase subunit type 1 TsaE [Bacillus sp. FJAT-49736]|uniref:tRNA (adenosine(37)-N6)-threonylcarbamoyltransferase complex ATPase subunit type 1 TsaE n=1 Tax=Bacillus sp. FJAT-49736 TaxID=2833582 RepID=UPI001BCA11F8|nr:tRNA (adenosine(37)-N6)-threonylcarbamoyltransferase complex ATPase subunit type 1 TsaE [Bacillus sp. FJAT-49736]MBS4175831.1 tRNA (adenosine(37)-N6)-threonylcarbamoyltransferase complex ATPase subunit type 1 TsaE [Bacillus sp. FJAT-49736]